MTHPIIKTENYLLVDDSNYYDEYYLIDMQIYKRDEGGNIPTKGGVWHKNITYHLPLNNAPILEGVPLLPPLEDESNFFAEQETIKNEWNSEKWFRCPNCKDEEIRRLQKFCSNCGNKFNWHEGSIIQGRL